MSTKLYRTVSWYRPLYITVNGKEYQINEYHLVDPNTAEVFDYRSATMDSDPMEINLPFDVVMKRKPEFGKANAFVIRTHSAFEDEKTVALYLKIPFTTHYEEKQGSIYEVCKTEIPELTVKHFVTFRSKISSDIARQIEALARQIDMTTAPSKVPEQLKRMQNMYADWLGTRKAEDALKTPEDVVKFAESLTVKQ